MDTDRHDKSVEERLREEDERWERIAAATTPEELQAAMREHPAPEAPPAASASVPERSAPSTRATIVRAAVLGIVVVVAVYALLMRPVIELFEQLS